MTKILVSYVPDGSLRENVLADWACALQSALGRHISGCRVIDVPVKSSRDLRKELAKHTDLAAVVWFGCGRERDGAHVMDGDGVILGITDLPLLRDALVSGVSCWSRTLLTNMPTTKPNRKMGFSRRLWFICEQDGNVSYECFCEAVVTANIAMLKAGDTAQGAETYRESSTTAALRWFARHAVGPHQGTRVDPMLPFFCGTVHMGNVNAVWHG